MKRYLNLITHQLVCFTKTMDAHCLTKFAHSKCEPELYERIINNLFAAYFADNKELAEHEVLIQAGIDADLIS